MRGVDMWRPEDNFQASVLSFLRVDLGDLIQVVRPGSKCLVLNFKKKIACAMCVA